jgi:hypothetical protein
MIMRKMRKSSQRNILTIAVMNANKNLLGLLWSDHITQMR